MKNNVKLRSELRLVDVINKLSHVLFCFLEQTFLKVALRSVYDSYEDFVSSLLNLGQGVVYVSLEYKSVQSESSKKEEDAISMFIKAAY